MDFKKKHATHSEIAYLLFKMEAKDEEIKGAIKYNRRTSFICFRLIVFIVSFV